MQHQAHGQPQARTQSLGTRLHQAMIQPILMLPGLLDRLQLLGLWSLWLLLDALWHASVHAAGELKKRQRGS